MTWQSIFFNITISFVDIQGKPFSVLSFTTLSNSCCICLTRIVDTMIASYCYSLSVFDSLSLLFCHKEIRDLTLFVHRFPAYIPFKWLILGFIKYLFVFFLNICWIYMLMWAKILTAFFIVYFIKYFGSICQVHV